MGNKKLLKEDLDRFNSIMGYNPSKGIIKEEGEQLSMDFPTELTTEEQEVSDALDAMLKYMKSNIDKYFYEYNVIADPDVNDSLNRYSAEYIIRNIKAKLKGDIENGRKGYPQSMETKLGRQKIIPFNKDEANTPEEFINLLDFIINSLGTLDISYYEIDRIKNDFQRRVVRNKEEEGWYDDNL